MDIDPENLPFLALLNVRNEGRDFSYRLVGTGVVENVGHEFTGERIKDYIEMHEVPEMLAAYVDAAQNRRPTLYEGSLKRLDREHVRYERLALPLADENGSVIQILAVFTFTRANDAS